MNIHSITIGNYTLKVRPYSNTYMDMCDST